MVHDTNLKHLIFKNALTLDFSSKVEFNLENYFEKTRFLMIQIYKSKKICINLGAKIQFQVGLKNK